LENLSHQIFLSRFISFVDSTSLYFWLHFLAKSTISGPFGGNLQAVKKKFKRVLRFCAKKVILSFIQVLHHMSEISGVKISAMRVV